MILLVDISASVIDAQQSVQIVSYSKLPKFAGAPTASDLTTPGGPFATTTSTVTKPLISIQKSYFTGKVLIQSINRHMTDFHDQQAARTHPIQQTCFY